MTQIRIIEQILADGTSGAPNEDMAGHSRCAAWVMDGATGLAEKPLLPGLSDAFWLVSKYNTLLQAKADNAGADVHELFKDCIDAVVRSFETERLHSPEARFEVPSAGIVFVRIARQRLEYARLGDCRAIFSLHDGTVVSTGRSGLHDLDERVIAKMRTLRDSGEMSDYADIRAAIQNDLRENRNCLNTHDGYWALATEPEAARHLETGDFSLAPGCRISGLLVTDGFYRLVDTFGIFRNDAALLAASCAQGLGPLIRQLRELEGSDPQCIAYPRFKVSDDATALLFEVEME